ncbi:MAG: response regulator [Clostridiales bacterium]|jgi:two-component system response regulator YesN|nr:response regulator [Clostridiales bacterium]
MYKILLADDEVEVLEGLKVLIPWENYGFRVCGAVSSGLLALEAMRENIYDLVITDIRMPGLSGLDLIKRLREANPSTNVVILSGYADFRYAQKALEMRVLRYLLKPVEEDELIEALKAIKAEFGAFRDDEEKPEPGLGANKSESDENDKLRLIISYINENLSQDLSLKELAAHFYYNAAYLGQALKSELGESLSKYLNKKRIDEVVRLNIHMGVPMHEALKTAGFQAPEYFYRQFKSFRNVSYQDFKKGMEKGAEKQT